MVTEGNPYLSIVVPAYNEARRIPITLERLQAYLNGQNYAWEIIVVSNGSSDDTEGVVHNVAGTGVRLISIPERGKGIATRTGALAGRGEVIFLCDADLSMPPETISRFIEVLSAADIAVGSREAPGARRFGEPSHRHFMGRVFNRVVKALAVPDIEDTQCGFKAMSRTAADDLFARQTIKGWAFDVEILYLARKLGYRVREVPIDWYFDTDTRVRPGVDSLHMLWEVIAIRLRGLAGRYGALKSSRGTGGRLV